MVMREPLLLPTSTRVLPLARKRRLVQKLAEALARAEGRQKPPLVRLLKKAMVLGRRLEDEVRQIRTTKPRPGSVDRLLEAMLQLSLKLGRVLRKARDLAGD